MHQPHQLQVLEQVLEQALEVNDVTAVLAFFFMLVIVAGMSVGVMMGRKPIAGSCGGMRALGLDTGCEVCGGDPKACESADRRPMRVSAAQAEAAALGEDATGRNGGREDVRTL